jgi:hypothetical protein
VWFDSVPPLQALEVPKYKWAIMGGLDSIAGIMQSLSVNYIKNGSLVVLLMQSAIPVCRPDDGQRRPHRRSQISLVVSKVIMKKRYTWYQYLGATIVAVRRGLAHRLFLMVGRRGGVAWSHRRASAVLPPPQRHWQQPPAVERYSCAFVHSHVPLQVSLWSMRPATAALTACRRSVYKEIALGDTDVDAVYMNGWIAIFQFIASFPLLIPGAYASDPVVEPKDIPGAWSRAPRASAWPLSHLRALAPSANLWDGMRCLVAVNSVYNQTTITNGTVSYAVSARVGCTATRAFCVV